MDQLNADVLFLLEDPFLSVPVAFGADWLERELRGILTEESVTVTDNEGQPVQLTRTTLAIATSRLPTSTQARLHIDETITVGNRRYKIRDLAAEGDGKITTLLLAKA